MAELLKRSLDKAHWMHYSEVVTVEDIYSFLTPRPLPKVEECVIDELTGKSSDILAEVNGEF